MHTTRFNLGDRMGGESAREVAEADIDYAWHAFLTDSPLFRHRFLEAIGAVAFCDVAGGQFHGARISVNSAFGETDVLAEWTNEAGQPLVVHIEDKLTAAFQPQQGARYAARAKAHAANVTVRTVLAAPRSYLAAANPEAAHFDLQLPLEDVLDWMASCELPSAGERLAIAREGLRRASEGFALGAKGLFPNLHGGLAQECKRRSNDLRITNNATDWVFFDHPSRPPGVEIRYRVRQNITELAFTPAFRGEVAGLKTACQPPFSFGSSGKTSFVRNAPPILSHDVCGGRLSSEDLGRIVASLEELLQWWDRMGTRASSGAPGA